MVLRGRGPRIGEQQAAGAQCRIRAGSDCARRQVMSLEVAAAQVDRSIGSTSHMGSETAGRLEVASRRTDCL